MEARKLKYNELPRISFRWVRANDLKLMSLDLRSMEYGKNPVVTGASHIQPLDELKPARLLGKYQGTNEEELAFVLKEARVRHHIVSSREEDLVRLKYHLSGEDTTLLELNVLEVRKGETLNVLMEYEGDETAEFASVLNLIEVEEGGTLNLYKINQLPHSSRHIEQRYAKVADSGTVNYYSVELGARETVINYMTDLAEKAAGYLKSIYIGNEERVIDLSHHMNHFGKESFCDMDIRGALKDRANKYFRGTLDFKRGSAGSEGGEVETVTLLDKTVKAFAIPLLLCGEHDVIGNHAASAGQLDENQLFYLMSRGFTFEESKRIIVESSFRPIIDLLPGEELRDAITERVGELMGQVTAGEL